MPNLWDRLPRESESAYRAFIAYRDLGPTRILDAVREALGGKRSGRGKPDGRIEAYCAAHDWYERCRAWDNHVQTELDKVALAERKKWEVRRIRNNERNFELGEQLRDRAQSLLKMPTTRRRVERHEERDPVTGAVREVEAVTIEPAKWTQRDIAVIAKTGGELTDAALADVGLTVGTESAPGGGVSLEALKTFTAKMQSFIADDRRDEFDQWLSAQQTMIAP